MLRTITALALSALLSTTAHAEPSAKWGKVGGWNIMVDRTVGDGCFALQYFDDNSVVRIGVNRTSQRLYLVFANLNWKPMEEGKVYRMRFVFDDYSQYEGDLSVIKLGDTTVLSHDNLTVDFVNDFARRGNMKIVSTRTGNRIANLSLANTAAAIVETANCQREMNATRTSEP